MKERLLSFVKEAYRHACIGTKEVRTPSELQRMFSLAVQCVQLVASYIEIDTGLMLRRVLYDEATSFLDRPYVPGASVENLTLSQDPGANCVAQQYAQWYKNMCDSAHA